MTSNRQDNNHSEKITFNQLFNRNTVRAQQTAENWQETVHIIGRLLFDDGGIDKTYIDAMIQVVKELGPYAVLAPGIVLLHARPEDGVRKPCMGLVTLTNPVNFGHTQNDPVDIVLALGAIDKKSHVQALQSVAVLLGTPAALADIRSAEDDATLLQTIQSWAAE